MNPSGRGASLSVGLRAGRGAPRRAHRDGLRRPQLRATGTSPSASRTPSSGRTTSAPRRRSSPRRELLGRGRRGARSGEEPGAVPHRLPRPARAGADAARLRALRRAAGHVLARGADPGLPARARGVRRLLPGRAELREPRHRGAARCPGSRAWRRTSSSAPSGPGSSSASPGGGWWPDARAAAPSPAAPLPRPGGRGAGGAPGHLPRRRLRGPRPRVHRAQLGARRGRAVRLEGDGGHAPARARGPAAGERHPRLAPPPPRRADRHPRPRLRPPGALPPGGRRWRWWPRSCSG